MNSLDDILIEKYLAGACTEADMEQILQWLNASEDNRKEWLKLRMAAAKSSFTQFSDPQHIARSCKELRKEQAARKRLEQDITRRIVVRFMRYAAGIVLLVGLSAIVYMYVADRERPRMVAAEVEMNGQPKRIVLDDSTRVWLSAGSRIEYPERFGKKERNVLVEGKVYFEAAKDAQRPFYVKTEAYTVKVLGTSFEVNSFKYRQTSDVTLVEGSVEILDNSHTTLCTLQPGQQFEFDRLNSRFTLHRVDAEIYTSWHGGKLEFDGLTFGEVAKLLERHYGVRIILEEGIAKEMKLVGSLSIQKDICEMMKTMELVVPIRYNVQTNTEVHIRPKN